MKGYCALVTLSGFDCEARFGICRTYMDMTCVILKRDTFYKVKEDEDFNRRNTLGMLGAHCNVPLHLSLTQRFWKISIHKWALAKAPVRESLNDEFRSYGLFFQFDGSFV
ncbi:MAG: hypothetical protein SVY10_00970 [Thermodesulfobacteriota bacterium]|nr:hypothetical protein [Thermodesulfobacteriota bacterium]